MSMHDTCIYTTYSHIDFNLHKHYNFSYILFLFQASAWLAFFLMMLMTVVYVIRSYIFFRRMRMKKALDQQPVLEDSSEESGNKPV